MDIVQVVRQIGAFVKMASHARRFFLGHNIICAVDNSVCTTRVGVCSCISWSCLHGLRTYT